MRLELNCLEQARVGVPREQVTVRDILLTTLRYREGIHVEKTGWPGWYREVMQAGDMVV